MLYFMANALVHIVGWVANLIAILVIIALILGGVFLLCLGLASMIKVMAQRIAKNAAEAAWSLHLVDELVHWHRTYNPRRWIVRVIQMGGYVITKPKLETTLSPTNELGLSRVVMHELLYMSRSEFHVGQFDILPDVIQAAVRRWGAHKTLPLTSDTPPQPEKE